MSTKIIEIDSLGQLQQFAIEFAQRYFPTYKKVLFYGMMGAGKTTFIKLLCQALGVAETTASPTFALVHQYQIPQGDCCIHHADLYRLQQPEEAFDIGLDDLFYDKNYLFIEWPELVEHFAPQKVLKVLVRANEQGHRFIEINEE